MKNPFEFGRKSYVKCVECVKSVSFDSQWCPLDQYPSGGGISAQGDLHHPSGGVISAQGDLHHPSGGGISAQGD